MQALGKEVLNDFSANDTKRPQKQHYCSVWWAGCSNTTRFCIFARTTIMRSVRWFIGTYFIWWSASQNNSPLSSSLWIRVSPGICSRSTHISCTMSSVISGIPILLLRISRSSLGMRAVTHWYIPLFWVSGGPKWRSRNSIRYCGLEKKDDSFAIFPHQTTSSKTFWHLLLF